jgi:hypothetical protein
LDAMKEVASQMQEIENEKIESLAKFFDSYDSEIAKEIRDKGLPVHAFCGKKMYPVVKEGLSHFFKVIKQPYCEDGQIMLSWIKEPNPFDAFDLMIEKQEDSGMF